MTKSLFAVEQSYAEDATRFMALIQNYEMRSFEMLNAVKMEFARQVAKKLVEDHYQEILGKMDMQAVANLVLADSANGIATELEKTRKQKAQQDEYDRYYRGW